MKKKKVVDETVVVDKNDDGDNSRGQDNDGGDRNSGRQKQKYCGQNVMVVCDGGRKIGDDGHG